MYGQHSARWIVLFVTTLIGGALLPSLPAMAAGRKPPAATGMPQGIDIAIERPANGSSETTGQPATNAVDGDATKHWWAGVGASDAQLTVSLDRPQQLNGTGVTWVGRAPAWYQVE